MIQDYFYLSIFKNKNKQLQIKKINMIKNKEDKFEIHKLVDMKSNVFDFLLINDFVFDYDAFLNQQFLLVLTQNGLTKFTLNATENK